MTAFVLGNGESRRDFDPNRLRGRGQIYGCNALYRDFAPDVLVATDTAISREIELTGYARQHVFYTRRPVPDSGALTIPRTIFGYSSGPVALGLAAAAGHSPIYLLGFDLGADPAGRFNNIYAGSACYKSLGSEPVFTGNWIRQLQRIVREHAHQHFIRVMGDTSVVIAEFDRLGNLASLPWPRFLAQLNNAEDKGCPLTNA